MLGASGDNSKENDMKATAKLSNVTIKDIGTWSGATVRADNSKTKAVDGLHADGVTSAMLKAPEKGESTVLFNSVKVAIVLGFTATVQALLTKDTKGLSEAKKEEKRYWQMQVGSKMKDLRNALTRREAQGSESDGAEADKSTWESTKRKVLSEMIAQAQKKESTTIRDIGQFIKDLQSALARIPANA